MADNPLIDLVDFLETKARKIRAIEAEGDAIIQATGDQRTFEIKIREKAKLLAAIAEDGWPLVEKVEGDLGDMAAHKLESFAGSASTALRIGSVFFMTALLYPEDYKQGEPNDLEQLAATLRAGLK